MLSYYRITMKQVINKEMMKQAIADLKSKGQKVNANTIYAALGFRGSMSTIHRLKAEVDADEQQPEKVSEEGLATFREVWALAREEGRKLMESVNSELKQDLLTMAQDNERLETEAITAAHRTDECQKAKSDVEVELATAKRQLANSQEALVQAAKDTQSALEKYAAEQTAHQTTQQELKKAIEKAHESELTAVRCSALLEASGQGGVREVANPTAATGRPPKNG